MTDVVDPAPNQAPSAAPESPPNDAVPTEGAAAAAPPAATPPPLPRRGPSRRALVARGVFVFLAGLAALSVPAWKHFRRVKGSDARERPVEAADAFVEGIVRAEGYVGDDPNASGYRAAYELLSAEKRAQLCFDDFYAEWARRADDAGYFERFERINRSPRGLGTSTRRRYRLSTSTRPGGEGAAYVLSLVMRQEADGFRVDAYSFAPETENDAR
jgi:hypothetical protein